ncbi:MAG: calcium/sodium antiporter [archaeon]|nr:calcium/sodium antiporter [Nanoarchaeota archaeon]
MSIIILILIFIASLVILIKGADYLVNGAADLAAYFKVSPIIIGLTLVAFGTSFPEFIVSLIAVLTGSPDLSIGNIIGSNIANIGLVIGATAIIMPLLVKSKTLMYEMPFMVVSSTLLLLLANNHYLFNQDTFILGRFDGIIFWIIFVLFIAYIYKSIKESQKEKDGELKSVKKEFKVEFKKHKNPLWKNSLLILFGLIMVSLGGRLFVYSSSEGALLLGLSEAFIGVTIVALGTSLPELMTCLVAAWKKEGDIAIGGIVGSNIFNVLFVLGTISIIKPIQLSQSLLFQDGMIMILMTLIFLIFATTGRKINRWEGAVLLLSYLAYIGFLIYSL